MRGWKPGKLSGGRRKAEEMEHKLTALFLIKGNIQLVKVPLDIISGFFFLSRGNVLLY